MSATAEVAQTDAVKFEMIPIASLRASETNPRKSFDPKSMAELVQSIAQRGVINPILVRPLKSGFEVVAGERRFRAARECGLEAIPATVRTLDDDEVIEIQVIENLNREDLEPMEEAEGFRILHERKKLSVDEIAGRIHRSPSYVYQRMRLARLPLPIKAAVTAGEIPVHAAPLLTSIPSEKQQIEALDDLRRNIGPLTLDHVRDVVRRYQTSMERAQWDVNDASLVPAAGACTGCLKRTGACESLFKEIENDVCLDAACFEAKSDAHYRIVSQKAIDSGGKVLSAKASKEVVPWGSTAAYGSGFKSLDETCHADRQQRSYRELLRDATLPITAAKTPDGVIVELVDEKAAIDVLKKKFKFAKNLKAAPRTADSRPRPTSKADSAAQEAKRLKAQEDRDRQAAKEEAVENACMAAIVAKAESVAHHAGMPLNENLDFVLRHMVLWNVASAWEVARRRWPKTKGDFEKALKKNVNAMKTNEVFGVLCELCVQQFQIPESAKALGIDVEAIEARIEAEMSAPKVDDAPKATRKKGGPTTAADAAARADQAKDEDDDESGEEVTKTPTAPEKPKESKKSKAAKK